MNPMQTLLSTIGNQPAGTDMPAADAPQPSAREAIVKLLELEGCKPRVINDGDIVFEYHELTYLVLFDPNDPEYLRVRLPGFHPIGSDNERPVAYEAANVINITFKGAKVVIQNGQTHAVIECFVGSPHHLVPVLMRCARALETAAKAFGVAYALVGRR